MGIGPYWVFSVGPMIMPRAWSVLTAVLGILLAIAALTAVPARIATRQPVAQILSTETT
jgi:putative ABC transport system permease protein